MRSALILCISVESLLEKNQFQHCSLLSYLWLQAKDDLKIKISIETDDGQDLREAKKRFSTQSLT